MDDKRILQLANSIGLCSVTGVYTSSTYLIREKLIELVRLVEKEIYTEIGRHNGGSTVDEDVMYKIVEGAGYDVEVYYSAEGEMMKTTLNKIRVHSPCEGGWSKLLRHLGKITSDDEPLELLTVLKGNGLDDTLWCLRAVEGHDRDIRRYVVWCARQVQHLMTDQRSLDALNVAERFADGLVTNEELQAAGEAARNAVVMATAETMEVARGAGETAVVTEAARAAERVALTAWLAVARDTSLVAAEAAGSTQEATSWAAVVAAQSTRKAIPGVAARAAARAAKSAQWSMLVKMCHGTAPWQEVK